MRGAEARGLVERSVGRLASYVRSMKLASHDEKAFIRRKHELAW